MPSFQVPVLGFAVRFLSLFPASLPQPFHRCLPSVFTSGIFHFRPASFRPLAFRFQLLSLLLLPFLLFPVPPRSGFPSARFHFRFLGFPFLPRPDFSCLPSRFLYSALLMVSFHPSLIHSRSCSSGAYLMLSLSVFSASVPLSFDRFSSASGYLASVSSFPLSSRLCLTVASSVRPLRFRFPGFPRSLRPGLPCLPPRLLVLGSLFVSFRPSRLRSHSCSTGASLLLSLSGFPLTSAFFRPLQLGSDYSAFRTFLSPLPAFPCRRFRGASFLFRPACFHAFLPIPVLSFLHFLSPLAVSPHSGYLSASALPCGSWPSPLRLRVQVRVTQHQVSAFRLLPVCRISRQR